ncbi:hypothetical protein GCM10018954_075690 [Kutzneria kofuensis]
MAERDAFLMTWYARMAVPRIDLDSARDRRIPLLRQRIEDETGWRILAFDTTVEQRIPCVWLLAVNSRRVAATWPGRCPPAGAPGPGARAAQCPVRAGGRS